MYLHAYIHMCVHACMHAWEYEHLGACTCVFICTLMCVRMHTCMYIFAISLQKYWSWHRWLPPTQYWKAFLRIWAKQQFLGHRLKHTIILLSFLKVRKDANISNRYTQVTHLTQDTPSGSDKTQLITTYKKAKRSALSKQVTTRLQ